MIVVICRSKSLANRCQIYNQISIWGIGQAIASWKQWEEKLRDDLNNQKF